MIAVLFARTDSNYKAMPGCDVWDEERDARRWPGGVPVVAHPPCRAWGRLRRFAKPSEWEKDLARMAVAHVRKYGGVLEHPAWSTLWADQGLPLPGETDEFGGWTLPISQSWWGHRAEKKTFLYIVGCAPAQIPDIPLSIAEPTHVVATRKRAGGKPEISKAEREHTPPALAVWLVELAGRCRVQQ